MSAPAVTRPRGSSAFRAIALVAALVCVLAACSSASGGASPSAAAAATGTIVLRDVGGKQVVVAGGNQMTVYIFTKDTPGVSACTDKCIANWPPLVVTGGATPTAGAGLSGKLGTITRADGAVQVTYNDLPLYFYGKDKAPGDLTGVYTNWELVKP